MKPDIQALVKNLDLRPHPEGGYFKETYRSSSFISVDNLEGVYPSKRSHSTCIYYLLTSDTFSAFHRIRQDEIWHFYQGEAVELHMIDPHGNHTKVHIGSEIESGHCPQFVVPGGVWFAAKVTTSDAYSLVGCTVSPGFDFDDFVLGQNSTLKEMYPQHSKLIDQFTRI